MMNNHKRLNQRHTRTSSFVLTAAALAMLAGAPAGYAQSSGSDEGGGLGSLMDFLATGDNGNEASNAQPERQPDFAGEFRTDGVYYDDNMTVELHVQDEELTNVLQMLSLQSERNIVASNEVSARVTANLYGVTFHEALDAILHVNGYGYIEKGNFIYVYPAETLLTIEQATRQIEGHVFHLNFLNAVDAADFVTPLLSESGNIKSNGKVAAWTDPTSPNGNEEFASQSTLIVYDYPENIDSIGRMLEELDTRPAQILVEATIVQTALNEANAFGVDFSIIADFDYADFATPLGAVDALLKGTDGSGRVPADGGASSMVSTAGGTSGPGTFKAGIVSNDVSVFLRMLNEITSTTIISNPKVVTLNRQPGRVLVGRKVGYLQTTSTQTSSTQSVEFLDTGTQLNFRPFVTGNGIIRMELKPQVSEAVLRTSTDATGAAVTIPDEVTNELTANVMVPDGHTIVLGGLFRESTTATRRQVPVLGDIPILGSAFRGHDDDIQRQEIIFLITPSIISDQVLVDQGLRAEDAVRRVRAGAREGTLPFSQTRQAAQLLVEAEQLAAEGKTSRALHKVRRALYLVPANTQAIELREQLVNKNENWPTDSILDDIIKGDAANAMELNILQHGWFGPTSKIDKPEPAQNKTRHASRASKHNNANRSAGFNRNNNSQASNNQPYNNTHNLYGDATNTTQSFDSDSWWTTTEFDMFMTTWAVASALERGEEFDADSRWWADETFISFVTEYQSEHAHNGVNSWWTSPVFENFLMVWGVGDADEQRMAIANANKHFNDNSSFSSNDNHFFTPNDHGWWQTSEFQQFTNAWSDAMAQEQLANGNTHHGSFVDTPEFQIFISAWSEALAKEQGFTGNQSNTTFIQSPEFQKFISAFGDAVQDEQFAKTHGTESDSSYTEVPSDK